MATGLSSSPLPPGWEMKFDQRSRKYFFINHLHKTTSWEDPRRLTSRPSASASIPLQTVRPNDDTLTFGRGVATTSFVMPSATDKDIASLKARFPRAPESQIKSTYNSLGYNVEKTATRLKTFGHTDVIDTLAVEFRRANKDIIKSVLESNSGNMQQTRKQLKEMGYGEPSVAQLAAKRNEEKERNRRRQIQDRLAKEFPHVDRESVIIALEANEHDMKKARTTLQTQFGDALAKSTRPHVPFPSELGMKSQAEKKRMLEKLQSEFSSAEKENVKLALEMTDYDEEMARNVLQASVSTSSTSARPPSLSPPRQMTSTTYETSSGVETTFPSVETTFPAFESTSEEFSLDSLLQQMEPSFSFLDSTQPERDDPTSRSAASYEPRQYQSHRYERQPITVTSSSSGFTSQLRTPAKGPDLSLWQGPDENLVSSQRVHASGPAKSLRKGPNPKNRKGPAALNKIGRGEVNFCGPQASNFSGPNPSLRVGAATY